MDTLRTSAPGTTPRFQGLGKWWQGRHERRERRMFQGLADAEQALNAMLLDPSLRFADPVFRARMETADRVAEQLRERGWTAQSQKYVGIGERRQLADVLATSPDGDTITLHVSNRSDRRDNMHFSTLAFAMNAGPAAEQTEDVEHATALLATNQEMGPGIRKAVDHFRQEGVLDVLEIAEKKPDKMADAIVGQLLDRQA